MLLQNSDFFYLKNNIKNYNLLTKVFVASSFIFLIIPLCFYSKRLESDGILVSCPKILNYLANTINIYKFIDFIFFYM